MKSSKNVCLYELIIIGEGTNKEWCCSIVKKYPDLIPYLDWGTTGITFFETKTWETFNCNDLVGGISMDQCQGIVISH